MAKVEFESGTTFSGRRLIDLDRMSYQIHGVKGKHYELDKTLYDAMVAYEDRTVEADSEHVTHETRLNFEDALEAAVTREETGERVRPQ